MDDKQLVNQFMSIISVVAAMAVLILIISIYLSSAQTEIDVSMRQSMQKNLAPVGKVHIGTVAAAETVSAETPEQSGETAASPVVMDAKATYDAVCAACHAAGVAEAPIYGNKEAWKTRLAKGVEALYASSLQGIGVMPAKGGRPDLSDEEIEAAVDYMLDAVR